MPDAQAGAAIRHLQEQDTAGAGRPADVVYNPYRDGPAVSMQRELDDVYHPAAQGLSGDVLDRIVRESFTRGATKGRQEEAQRSARRFADIFDDGSREGIRVGAIEGKRLAAAGLAPGLIAAREALGKVIELTTSQRIAEAADEALGVVVPAAGEVERILGIEPPEAEPGP